MENERYEKWYEEAKEQTLETLPVFMKKILDEPQSYESIVEAIAACAVGAAWAADHSPNGGITGFQGSCVMWRFIQYWMRMEEGEPLKLVRYNEMLYPQYNYKFAKTISGDTWDWLQEQADKCLNENGYAHPDVIAHWKSIVNGVIPFGYTVEEDK